MGPHETKAQAIRQEDRGNAASELAVRQILTRIFVASTAGYEMAVRIRKHFRIGPGYWTLIPQAA